MPDRRSSRTARSSASPAYAALRARLGLPATATQQEVVTAAAAALRDGTSVAVEALRRNVGLNAGASAQDVADAAARLIAARQAAAAPTAPVRGSSAVAVLDWATSTGRIAAASRASWEDKWMADPVRTDALLRMLAPLPSTPLMAAVASASPETTDATSTGPRHDVSTLPARIQNAAARQSDPAVIAGWVSRYAGMSHQEVHPDMLRLDGEDWLAEQVGRDEQDAAFAASLAERQAFEINAAALQRQNAATAEWVRDHGDDRVIQAGGQLRQRTAPPA